MIVGLGTDVVDIDRFRFDELKRERFAKRVFTETEMAYAMRHRNVAQSLAGAFAAKEATRKAFGRAIPWRMIGVRHEHDGTPCIELRGGAQALISTRGVRTMHLTIAHSRNSALATVVLETEDFGGGLVAVRSDQSEVAAR
ncbi:MAG: holo-ACP synthase [Candidatus Eremiobacteraeota bacterium]|nr:holo-ACP synthase [Candidatus Eremiobacteraeota bacterium]